VAAKGEVVNKAAVPVTALVTADGFALRSEKLFIACEEPLVFARVR